MGTAKQQHEENTNISHSIPKEDLKEKILQNMQEIESSIDTLEKKSIAIINLYNLSIKDKTKNVKLPQNQMEIKSILTEEKFKTAASQLEDDMDKIIDDFENSKDDSDGSGSDYKN